MSGLVFLAAFVLGILSTWLLVPGVKRLAVLAGALARRHLNQRALCGGQVVRMRADDRAFGQQAQGLTAALVAGRKVDVEQKDVDRYGRIVGLVEVNGQSLNELIIQNGYAWVFAEYCQEKFCDDWVRLEWTARQQKKLRGSCVCGTSAAS